MHVRHRLVLTNENGAHEVLCFPFGSTGSPARLTDEMPFIGDRAFTRDSP